MKITWHKLEDDCPSYYADVALYGVVLFTIYVDRQRAEWRWEIVPENGLFSRKIEGTSPTKADAQRFSLISATLLLADVSRRLATAIEKLPPEKP